MVPGPDERYPTVTELEAYVTQFTAKPGERTSSGALPRVGSGTLQDPTTLAVAGMNLTSQGNPHEPTVIPYGTLVFIEGYGWALVQSLCGACTPGNRHFNLPPGADIRVDLFGTQHLGNRRITIYGFTSQGGP